MTLNHLVYILSIVFGALILVAPKMVAILWGHILLLLV